MSGGRPKRRAREIRSVGSTARPRRAAPSWRLPIPELSDRPAGFILGALIGIYVAIYGALCLVKHRYFLYTDFDLAIFRQAVDRLLHGSTWNSIRGMDWRGDHSSWLLYLMAPIYALYRHSTTLLVLQTLGLGLGAIPVYRLASRTLVDQRLALACAALYLAYPAVGYLNLFEFHPEALCTPALLFALDALFEGSWSRLFVFAGLALLGKEDAALAVMGVATLAVVSLRPRRPAMALALAAMAAVSLAITFGWARPAFSLGQAEYGRMYAEWGSSTGSIATGLLRHPLHAAAALFGTPGNPLDSLGKRQYFLHLLAPFLFLPLLAPATLLVALPLIAEHMLSTRGAQHSIVHQYTALITPFVTIAAVQGAANLRRWSAQRGHSNAIPGGALAVALAASLASNVMFGPLSPLHLLQAYAPTERTLPSPADRAAAPFRDRLIRRIPRDAPAVASYEYLEQLAGRAKLYSFQQVYSGGFGFSRVPYSVPHDVQAVLASFGDQYDADAMLRVRELLHANQLHPVDAADDLVLYVSQPADTLGLVSFGSRPRTAAVHVLYAGQLAFVGSDLPDHPVARGERLEIQTYWRREAEVDRAFLMRLWLFDAAEKPVLFRTRYLGYGVAEASTWPPEADVRESYRWVMSPALSPGTYRLVMQVVERQGNRVEVAQTDDAELRAAGGLLSLGTVEVR